MSRRAEPSRQSFSPGETRTFGESSLPGARHRSGMGALRRSRRLRVPRAERRRLGLPASCACCRPRSWLLSPLPSLIGFGESGSCSRSPRRGGCVGRVRRSGVRGRCRPCLRLCRLVGVSSTLIRPTLQALLPSLARTPEELIASNGATSTIESVGTLVGPLAAGALIAVAPVGVVFAAAGRSRRCGAVLLDESPARRSSAKHRATARAGAYRELRSGFEAFARLPGARRVLGLMIAQTFVRGCLNVLIVVAAFRVLHAGAGAVGYMTAAIGVGGLVGALRAMTLQGRRLAGPVRTLTRALGIADPLIPVIPS